MKRLLLLLSLLVAAPAAAQFSQGVTVYNAGSSLGLVGKLKFSTGCVKTSSGVVTCTFSNFSGGTVTTPILFPDGTEALPSMAFTSSPNMGWSKSASGFLAGSVGGAYALAVNGSIVYFKGALNSLTGSTLTVSVIVGIKIGDNITDAATIAPDSGWHKITGTGTSITTITAPSECSTESYGGGHRCCIKLTPTNAAGVTFATGGNIALGRVVVQNQTTEWCYDGSSWFPQF